MHAWAAGGASGGQIILGLALWAAAIAAYFVPAIIAAARHVPNAGSVIVVDLLLGWTVIGWIVALAMAFRSKPVPYPPPYSQPGWQPPRR